MTKLISLVLKSSLIKHKNEYLSHTVQKLRLKIEQNLNKISLVWPQPDLNLKTYV